MRRECVLRFREDASLPSGHPLSVRGPEELLCALCGESED